MSRTEWHTVSSARERREFTAFPKRLYAGSGEWVPPMDADMRSFLLRKHPYFEGAEAEFFLFSVNGRTVGRAAALLNQRYNAEHLCKSVHFYFVDFIDDREVSSLLFSRLGLWAAERGMDTLVGPLFSGATMGGGVLVQGFEHRAAMTMMPYNYPYYRSHYEAVGFEKRFDLHSLSADPAGFRMPERIETLADRVRSRGRFEVARIENRRHLRRIADEVADLYNPTLADHSENYPLTPNELETLKKDLLLIADPDLEKIIRYDGRVVGFIFSFPDLSAAMQKNGGKLGPVRIVRLLRERGRTRKIIFNGMGILEKYQKLGGNALLYSELAKSVSGTSGRQFDSAEMVQINETTDLMLKDMTTVGAAPFKLHRVYQRGLS